MIEILQSIHICIQWRVPAWPPVRMRLTTDAMWIIWLCGAKTVIKYSIHQSLKSCSLSTGGQISRTTLHIQGGTAVPQCHHLQTSDVDHQHHCVCEKAQQRLFFNEAYNTGLNLHGLDQKKHTQSTETTLTLDEPLSSGKRFRVIVIWMTLISFNLSLVCCPWESHTYYHCIAGMYSHSLYYHSWMWKYRFVGLFYGSGPVCET